MLPAQPNQSIIAGMQCLEEIVSLKEPIGSRELARLLGEEPTKINRILGTLCHLGYIEKTQNNKYKAGPAIHVISSLTLSSSKLLRVAADPIKELLKTGLTVALGVLWKNYVSYIFHGNQKMPFEASIGSKELFPSERSSIGKIILAHKNQDPSAEEKKILRAGYYQISASSSDYSLAVPIGEPNVIAGLALAGNKNTFNTDELLSKLKESAEIINSQLKS